jgi:hypothetical protein
MVRQANCKCNGNSLLAMSFQYAAYSCITLASASVISRAKAGLGGISLRRKTHVSLSIIFPGLPTELRSPFEANSSQSEKMAQSTSMTTVEITSSLRMTLDMALGFGSPTGDCFCYWLQKGKGHKGLPYGLLKTEETRRTDED